MFINTQNMGVQSKDHDNFWELDDDFRMEILLVSDEIDPIIDNVLYLSNDTVRMYCGM